MYRLGAATLRGSQSGWRAPVYSTTEDGTFGAQNGAQGFLGLSGTLSEVELLESWWDEPHCEDLHYPWVPKCSHVPVALFSAECLNGRPIRVCANLAEYARAYIADHELCTCGALCRDCWRLAWL